AGAPPAAVGGRFARAGLPPVGGPGAAAVEDPAAGAAADGIVSGDGAVADDRGRAGAEEEAPAGAPADVAVHRAVLHQQEAVGGDEDAAAEPLGKVVGDDHVAQEQGLACDRDGAAMLVAAYG